MKTVIINAGPRNNHNTAKLLQKAKEGAEAAGAQTQYANLYDFSFTGCRGCMACKRKGIEEPCKCYWKDELSPLIESVYSSDLLLIGTPVYFYQPTGIFREFLERVCFPALTYNDFSSVLKGKVNVGVFLTMNVNQEKYDRFYREIFETQICGAFRLLNGETKLYPSCDTLQVDDYSKYEMAAFDESHKREVNGTQFAKELERAYEIGRKGLS